MFSHTAVKNYRIRTRVLHVQTESFKRLKLRALLEIDYEINCKKKMKMMMKTIH